MPVVESRCVVPVDVNTAFAVSQTTGEIRKRWDPFIREQHFEGGATRLTKGVYTHTVQRFGFRMQSEYVSYNPPRNVGMKMTKGSWFFEKLVEAAGASARSRTGRDDTRRLALQLHVQALLASARGTHRRGSARARHRTPHQGLRQGLRRPVVLAAVEDRRL